MSKELTAGMTEHVLSTALAGVANKCSDTAVWSTVNSVGFECGPGCRAQREPDPIGATRQREQDGFLRSRALLSIN